MKEMITRQNKTADGLRHRLFDTLDALIEGKIKPSTVENICMVSDQILNSAKLELEIELARESTIRETREFERLASERAMLKLEDTIQNLEVLDV